ncbi:MAG: hypothetical protein LAT68_13075 [Cyclobacteriaceae bacterium]|nr:hypothetical protein [Cyclobacteriaceae bacterium]MCH8517253.1 hypothetical protein [Cyclobacteriaceae bacterium]
MIEIRLFLIATLIIFMSCSGDEDLHLDGFSVIELEGCELMLNRAELKLYRHQRALVRRMDFWGVIYIDLLGTEDNSEASSYFSCNGWPGGILDELIGDEILFDGVIFSLSEINQREELSFFPSLMIDRIYIPD